MNLFINEGVPETADKKNNSKTMTNGDQINNSGSYFGNSSFLTLFPSTTSSTSSPSSSSSLLSSTSSATAMSTEDAEILKLSQSVSQLHDISITMNKSLIDTNAALDRVSNKSETVFNKTLVVTLQTSQLTRRNSQKKSEFVGCFQFIETVSKRFLAVDAEDNITLSPTLNRATYFDIYAAENNLFGIFNNKTLKYLGSTWLGGVKCAGLVFGRQEECHLQLINGEKTGERNHHHPHPQYISMNTNTPSYTWNEIDVFCFRFLVVFIVVFVVH